MPNRLKLIATFALLTALLSTTVVWAQEDDPDVPEPERHTTYNAVSAAFQERADAVYEKFWELITECYTDGTTEDLRVTIMWHNRQALALYERAVTYEDKGWALYLDSDGWVTSDGIDWGESIAGVQADLQRWYDHWLLEGLPPCTEPPTDTDATTDGDSG